MFTCAGRALASFESLFKKCAHPSEVPLPNKKAKGICLLVACHDIPVLVPGSNIVNKDGSVLVSTIFILVNAKTITSATPLISIANAGGSAVR